MLLCLNSQSVAMRRCFYLVEYVHIGAHTLSHSITLSTDPITGFETDVYPKVRAAILRRDKTIIRHLLPDKVDHVVFCPLSAVQNDAYLRLLNSPDYQLMCQYVLMQ